MTIWQKIWERIKDHPERLDMRYFFTDGGCELLHKTNYDDNTIKPDILHECKTAACVLGWATLISLEEGLTLNTKLLENTEQIFGEELGDLEDPKSLRWLFFNFTDEEAYNEVKRRALEGL